MMWVRRLVAGPFIIFFFLLFLVVLVMTQTNCTFGNPGFYNDQLRQADIYNFLYDEALPAALDEIETDESSDFQIDITEIKDDLVSAAREILPPEWLEERVESATETVIPYILGSTDSFTYTVEFKDRVETAAEVIKDDILGGDPFNTLYDEAISQATDEVLKNMDKMPYSLTLDEEQIESFLRTVADRDWIVSETNKAIDAVMPYFTGESEHFAITLNLQDRVDPVSAAAIDLLSRPETYDYLVDEIITPIVLENIGSSVNLSYGITLSQAEIASVVKQALPQSWVEERLEELVNALADYVKSETAEIRIVVDLSDIETEVLATLTETADDKLEAEFYSLPLCNSAEFFQATQNLTPGSIPSCRLTGTSYQNFKTMFNINVAATVEQKVGSQIPEQWVYTDADLRESLGEDDADFLEKARDKVTNGWTFTEVDLRDKLDSEDEQTLKDVRGYIKNGYAVTEADLRDKIAENDSNLNDFDNARHRINGARTWLWTFWLIPFAFLVLIAFLCGRNWVSRAVCGLAVLFFTALIVYICTAAIFALVAEPRLEEGAFDPSQYEGVAAVMAEKGNELIHNVASSFAANIKHTALYFMIGSVVILFGLLVWQVVLPRTRATPPQAPS
ncbi:MAG TPA: hypothetical protein VMW64_01375 [Dehalococcoidia bacterium]|nr:hypothetical protein [Dehalococcoidia bacterium]